MHKFDNDTKQLLYNGFQYCDNIQQANNMRLDPSKRLAVQISGVGRGHSVKNVDFLNPSAWCHCVPEPLEENRRYWMMFSGFLSDELASNGQLLLESGLGEFWKHLESTWSERYTVRLARMNQTAARRIDPAPISMDFEIMRIFSICGCMLLATFAVFLAECACHHGKEPTKRACREIKAAGSRVRAWARAAWKMAWIRGQIHNWLRKIEQFLVNYACHHKLNVIRTY